LEDNFWFTGKAVDLNPQVLRINKLVFSGSSVFFAFDVSAVLAKLDHFSAWLLVMSAVWEIDSDLL
jgi:hypothetical protein